MYSDISDKITVNIDGGSRGNPGPAAYAFTVSFGETTLYQEAKYIGITTNNYAEYQGLINALKYLSSNSYMGVQIEMDSLLVVQQINGKYKVKHPQLQLLHQQATKILSEIINKNVNIIIIHVYRDKNQKPDLLLNECLDQHGK